MSTEMSLDTSEFDTYEYKSQNESEQLVFCIRELKALLSLCDAVETINDLYLFFCSSGSPIKFSTKCMSFEVSLIMATLETHHVRTAESQAQEERQLKRQRGQIYDDEDEKDEGSNHP